MIGTDLQLFIMVLTGAFWIFVLWVLWSIARSFQGMNESLKEIADTLRQRKHVGLDE